MEFRSRIKSYLRIRNTLIRQGLAEFLGTFMLVVIGDGAVAQTVLSREANGSFLSMTISALLAVALGVWVAGGVSGGHINPAISFLMAVLGRISPVQMFVYMVSQYLGAFTAAACVYSTYIDALNNFDGGQRQVYGHNATAAIFATYPAPYVSTLQGFWGQVFETLLLALLVLAITDENNISPSVGGIPPAVGSAVMAICCSYGLNSGSPLNPARDFSPRLFTFIAGWGSEVFSAYNYWFWVPLVAPHIGVLIGGWIYLLMIGIHLEPLPQETKISTNYIAHKPDITENGKHSDHCDIEVITSSEKTDLKINI